MSEAYRLCEVRYGTEHIARSLRIYALITIGASACGTLVDGFPAYEIAEYAMSELQDIAYDEIMTREEQKSARTGADIVYEQLVVAKGLREPSIEAGIIREEHKVARENQIKGAAAIEYLNHPEILVEFVITNMLELADDQLADTITSIQNGRL